MAILLLTAEEVISLKNKVEAEINRRKGYGPLSSKGNFTNTPSSGSPMYADQGYKVIHPILQVDDYKDMSIKSFETGKEIPKEFNNELITSSFVACATSSLVTTVSGTSVRSL